MFKEFINDNTETQRGDLLIASCTAGTYLSKQVVEQYRTLQTNNEPLTYLENIDYRFANTETCVRLEEHVSGHDIFLFQSLCDPTGQSSVDQNYMAFLMAVRAFREHGASHITGILPYLAYGRQDKPTEFKREPTSARLMADLSIEAGIDRLITWHAHCGQIRGFYGSIPTNMLDPLSLFIDRFQKFRGQDDVIAVAPDAGASKLAMYFSQAMDLDCAIGSKFRPRPDEATLAQIVGDFSGKKTAIVVEDELSTGGTLKNLFEVLTEENGIESVYVGLSHNRCMPEARDRLLDLYDQGILKEIVVTDSMPQTEDFENLPFLSICSLSDPLTRVINRIHNNRSVSEVFFKP
ncbi:MAG: ribose-phosphate diphosphokinase [Candidatus Latescibacteria bacterium]|jgi:ribose-phosphate pyrophosphokinase|nr:ribose-phosphate diphosphokinase [Candidatus Latescibacterota bacterium]